MEPVATKNGDVYERRLIEKHIATGGVDPVTKQPISVSDLIPLKGTLRLEASGRCPFFFGPVSDLCMCSRG